MVNNYKIGILIPATSKLFNWETIKESYLYKLTISSLIKTYDTEHKYIIYLGYDEGDKIYGDNTQHNLIHDLLKEYDNLDIKFISMKDIEKGYVTIMWR